MSENTKTLKIGLLATGDEIALGDILNTNAQNIALRLAQQGFIVGNHMVATDQEDDIVNALQFLLAHHQVVIITGGLGPTSDDRTRYALSRVTGKHLIFDDASWQAIINRLNHFNIVVHESNKQQALFPQGAHIIPNPNGTAAGCYVEYEDKLIFLLPGPPKECLPMFDAAVLPQLIERYGLGPRKILKWRLFGVIEADIAAMLDELLQGHPCTTGFRIDYPYLECKVYTENHADLEHLSAIIDEALQAYCIDKSHLKASELLIKILSNDSCIINIIDNATAGYLESKLSLPHLKRKIIFHQPYNNSDLKVTIQGLTEFWDNDITASHTHLSIQLESMGSSKIIEKHLPMRQYPNSLLYAVEFISWEIYKHLLIN